MHVYSRSARRGACCAGRVIGRPRYSARRAKVVGFGGEFGGSPGGESGRDWCMDVGRPVRAATTQGTRLGGSHHGLGNGGCCKVGVPAEESFDATARDNQHEYDGRSLRETDRGGCWAAPGGWGYFC
jgi:hypothetical protein